MKYYIPKDSLLDIVVFDDGSFLTGIRTNQSCIFDELADMVMVTKLDTTNCYIISFLRGTLILKIDQSYVHPF